LTPTEKFPAQTHGKSQQFRLLRHRVTGRAQNDGLTLRHGGIQDRASGGVRAEVHHDVALRHAGWDVVAQVGLRPDGESHFSRRAGYGLAHAAARAVDQDAECHVEVQSN
jgi:hypothetical protein